MKSTSMAAGTVSGCLVWLVLVAVFGVCLIPLGFVFALFTETTELAARTVGPIVCPANSVAKIETSPTTYIDENGVELQAVGAEMVCVNEAGTVVANPAPLPNWVWGGLVFLSAVLLAGLLAFVFAAPAGVVVGGVISRLKKKRAMGVAR